MTDLAHPESTEAAKHPPGLFLLFASEMWERFSYYGMRAVLTLYLTKALLYDKEAASTLYGGYVGLIYLTPLIGGFVADRYWGNRRSIIVGGLTMSLGQFTLFASALLRGSEVSVFLLFLGLGLMIVGNGFFKPNISSMVGSLYSPTDRRRDAAYTIFYMGINLGSFLGNLVTSLFGDTGNPDDFKWAFLSVGIAMALGTLIFHLGKAKYLVSWDGKAVGTTPANSPGVKQVYFWLPALLLAGLALLYLDTLTFEIPLPGADKPFLFSNLSFYILVLAGVAIAYIVFSDKTLDRIDREKVAVIFIVSFFVIFFWATFEQAPASLTFFADEQTDRQVNLHTSMWVMMLLATGLGAALYWGLSRAVNIPSEFKTYFFAPIGLALAGSMVYYLIFPKPYDMEEVPPSLFQNLNAFFVVTCAPLMAFLWGFLGKYKAEPASQVKMAWGLVLVTLGYVVIEFAVKDLAPAVKVSMMYLIVLYFLHTIGELCMSPIGLSLVNKLSPPKFISLMMAVWFLAPAIANKAAGMISAYYPEGGKTKHFLGFDITNLYEFFLINVFISGSAALLLFLIARRLGKMMHGIK
jgi:proton-dependent oligopeptide transporter, POT family